ncbi:aspartate/glutamate racemase family protein [Komagataeibacter sp. FNDCF1]|uniref:aspartate/glutamate racemase family protein n=1 Tax=Komagataeibacter sp. FNDCF1 TaxID=2878681 RepID=UPI001E2BDB25|nr:aspartate/glutamate racemase family protein [Komagataeibacter sp. FNDCF1]MCE2564786.1 aspartate/glutamate racemase family protein [Komagataeibacter sp. FNDCF1]
MRVLGLLGGMSWESTAIYYRLLNEGVRARKGGLHSAPSLLWSPDFAPIAERQREDDWSALTEQLSRAGQHLKRSGAEALLICSNTMHCLHEAIEQAAEIPALHIADATGEALQRAGCKHPVLLATRFTMEREFYTKRLRDLFGITARIPDGDARIGIHRIIYEELCRGIIRDESREHYRNAVRRMQTEGADSVILGCTEIAMLISQDDIDLPIFDTTAIHADMGVSWMLD